MCPKKYEIHISNAKYGHHGNGNVHVNHELQSQNYDKGNLIIREGVKKNGD